LETLLLKRDKKDTSGMGCFSVLLRLRVFVACTRLWIYQLCFYDAMLYLISCVAYVHVVCGVMLSKRL